jgi:hypothetical protein
MCFGKPNLQVLQAQGHHDGRQGDQHDTQQMTATYRSHVHEEGLYLAATGRRRDVLTTREDGHITFATDDEPLRTETECGT